MSTTTVNEKKGRHVCVIGGGAIGAMSAWYLLDAGFDVTIVDRERFGAACSRGNCGYVAPSHVLPLCRPGAVKNSMGSLLEPNSAFSIKPRLSGAMMRWFWGFMRACNERDMHVTAEALDGLLRSSHGLYLDLVREHGIECDWQDRGLMHIHDTEKALDGFEATARMLRERYALDVVRYDAEELREIEPAIKPIVAGAWHFRGDSHIRPDLMMASMRAALERRGARIVEGANVEGFRKERGTARALETASGEPIEADSYVVATGAWTPFLQDDLGFHVPIQPGKGYSITTSAPAVMPRHPLIFEESHVAITPMTGAYRVGSTMEFVGYDTSIREKRLRLLTGAAEKYLVDPMGETTLETWFGWRPMVYDGRPIIDRAPALDNVWVAAGHSMIGISLATGTGKLVSELVAGEAPHVPVEPFSASRF